MITVRLKEAMTPPLRTSTEVVLATLVNGSQLLCYWPPANEHPMFRIKTKSASGWFSQGDAETLRDALSMYLGGRP